MAPSPRIVNDLIVLHKSYMEGRLKLLVGAGASMMSGFPSWPDLERGLLNAFLTKDLDASTATVQIPPSLLKKISSDVYDKLGQGAVDLVWNNTASKPDFFKMFGEVLYAGRSIQSLLIPTLHRQLAAMNRAKIFTTNYDPLIELAFARVRDDIRIQIDTDSTAWQEYIVSIESQSFDTKHVYHLHGYVDPEGDRKGDCVLTEGHYFQLAENQKWNANRILLNALDGDGVLLILGMSLNDRNLKRLLYEGTRTDIKQRTIYAILKEDDAGVSAYQVMHWKHFGINLVFVSDYLQIEGFLRQVKYGPYLDRFVPAWVSRSTVWLSERGISEAVFTDDWQENASVALNKLKDEITTLFPPCYGEKIGLNLLMPMMMDDQTRLHLVARTQHQPLNGATAEAMARLHAFEIGYHHEQGSSGAAFVDGQTDVSCDEMKLTHRNIPRQKWDAWRKMDGFQGWRSIISIPLRESPDWVPVCILSITSNQGIPFWSRFGPQESLYMRELEMVVRGAIWEHFLPKSRSSDDKS